MSVNDPIFLGMNTIELVAIPVMLVLFAFAVWYGIVRGADGSPVLWAKRPRPERKEAARKAA